MSKNAELKLCPFCGGKVALHTVDIDDRNWVVECEECRCATPWCADKKIAVQKWNARNADIRPERHGEWLESGDCYECSECGGGSVVNTNPYCWKCGAKMDGKDGESDGIG